MVQRIPPEGRVMVKSDGTFEYQYFLKDYLGNTRITFNEDDEILQEDCYYPFGMSMTGLTYQNGLDYKNKYLYNGKEMQDEFGLEWYDYGARMYDPQLGRWHVVDPFSEKALSYSMYIYGFNDPIKMIDPDGCWPFDNIIIQIAANYVAMNYSVSESAKVVFTTVTNMEPPKNTSTGADIIKFGISTGINLSVNDHEIVIGQLGIGTVLNEDEGLGAYGEIELGNEVGKIKGDIRIYESDQNTNMELKSELSVETYSPDLGNSKNEDIIGTGKYGSINVNAVIKVIKGAAETMTNYVQEKYEEIVQPYERNLEDRY